MELKARTCPNCKAQLNIDPGVTAFKCEYCGTSITVESPKVSGGGPNFQNLLSLANTAKSAGNYREAYDYYNRVLEIDHGNVNAWFEKGVCAGGMSTLADFRIPEMLVAFRKAIASTPSANRSSLEKKAGQEINSCTIAYYRLARESLAEYVSLDDTWAEYLDQCDKTIDALEVAHKYCPTDKQVLENVIFICRDNVEGVAYHDQYDMDDDGNPKAKVKRITKAYENMLRGKRDHYIALLKKLDPAYKPKKIRKATHFSWIGLVLKMGLLVLCCYLAYRGYNCMCDTYKEVATPKCGDPNVSPPNGIEKEFWVQYRCKSRKAAKRLWRRCLPWKKYALRETNACDGKLLCCPPSWPPPEKATPQETGTRGGQGATIRFGKVCNVRSGRSTQSDVVARTERDGNYSLLKTVGRWRQIRLQYRSRTVVGWIACKPAP